jgi:hypothetical protein
MSSIIIMIMSFPHVGSYTSHTASPLQKTELFKLLWVKVVFSCALYEHGDETSGSIECYEMFECPSDFPRRAQVQALICGLCYQSEGTLRMEVVTSEKESNCRGSLRAFVSCILLSSRFHPEDASIIFLRNFGIVLENKEATLFYQSY